MQVNTDRFKARTRTASAEEKATIWPKMVAEWPDYDAYQDKQIPGAAYQP